MAARGVMDSYEMIREWACASVACSPTALKQRRPNLDDKWHLDEVFIRTRGKLHYLRREIDQHGHVLDILIQSPRDARAAGRLFRKLLRDLPPLDQPGRSVAPDDTPTGTADAAVKVSGACATLPVHPRPHLQPRLTPSLLPEGSPALCRAQRRTLSLARDDQR